MCQYDTLNQKPKTPVFDRIQDDILQACFAPKIEDNKKTGFRFHIVDRFGRWRVGSVSWRFSVASLNEHAK